MKFFTVFGTRCGEGKEGFCFALRHIECLLFSFQITNNKTPGI